MTDHPDQERLLVEHLEHVNRVVRFTCRRYGLGSDDAEDCCSWVALKLVEDDYATLRKFRGESSIKTFLTVVVTMLVRDYRVQQWGRWRPSAAVMRLGPLAVRLETLTRRDGLTFEQAVELLRQGTDLAPSNRELAHLYAQIPPRGPVRPRPVGEEALAQAPAVQSAEAGIAASERARETGAIEQMIAGELERLDPEERLVMRLLYFEAMSVADIARGLGLPQKPLYRRIERVKTRLRERLEASGVSRERVAALIHEAAS